MPFINLKLKLTSQTDCTFWVYRSFCFVSFCSIQYKGLSLLETAKWVAKPSKVLLRPMTL